MGFGLPAAMGAKFGAPDRTVCFFTGDGGMQMTIQELGTIMQEKLNVKIIILNNNFLGMVRQWQELFFHERYSNTIMENPDSWRSLKPMVSLAVPLKSGRNWTTLSPRC